MSDALETYYLFSGSFDDAAKIQLYTALEEISGLELSKPPEIIEEWFAEGRDVATNFNYNSSTPRIDFTPDSLAIPDLAYFTLDFEILDFDERLHGSDEVEQNVEQAIDLIVRVYELAADIQEQPQYVIGADETHTEQIRSGHQAIHLTEDGVRSGTLENLFWLQIWSPDFVDSIGRDVIEIAPTNRIEWLDDGSVLVTNTDPLYRSDYFELLDHFGLDRPS